jgi:hypothetical protein
MLGAGRPKPALLFLWERKSKQKVQLLIVLLQTTAFVSPQSKPLRSWIA